MMDRTRVRKCLRSCEETIRMSLRGGRASRRWGLLGRRIAAALLVNGFPGEYNTSGRVYEGPVDLGAATEIPQREGDPMTTDRDETHNARINVWNGLFKSIGIRLVNPYLGINMIRLGAPNLYLGVMMAIPYLSQGIAAWVGPLCLSHTRHPHRATQWLFVLARLGYGLLALVDLGYWSWNPPLAFLIAVILLNLPAAVATLSWQALLGRILGGERRAGAVMWRQWGMNGVGTGTLLLGGVIIGQAQGVRAYGGMDLGAVLIGLMEVAVYRQFRMTQPAEPTWGEPTAGTGDWRHIPGFPRFLLAGTVFYFGWLFLWPVALRYQVDDLGSTNAWMAYWAMANAVATMIALPLWHRIRRHFAVTWLLPCATLLMVVSPAGYMLTPSKWGIIGLNTVGGLSTAGLNFLVFIRALDLTPEASRIRLLGLYAALTNLAAGLGAIAAVGLMVFAPMAWSAGISALIRLLGVGLYVWAGFPGGYGRGQGSCGTPRRAHSPREQSVAVGQDRIPHPLR